MKKCFVCEGTAEHYCNWQNFKYIKCLTCNLLYVDILPSKDEMFTAYNGGNWKNLRRKLVSPFRKLHHLSGYNSKMIRSEKIMEICLNNLTLNNNLKCLILAAIRDLYLLKE